MKILVVEDKQMHRDSARETLQGHDLAIVESFDEAMRLLEDKTDFEVVLTDMMMPMSRKTLAPEAFNRGEQVPYGFVIALRAALMGAKFVAMVTDTNHHKGAMSAAIDCLGSGYYHEGFSPNFEINGAKVMFVHTPFVKDIIPKSCNSCDGTGKCKYCEGTGTTTQAVADKYPAYQSHVGHDCIQCPNNKGKCSSCEGTGDGTRYERKDWGQVLSDLISAPVSATA